MKGQIQRGKGEIRKLLMSNSIPLAELFASYARPFTKKQAWGYLSTHNKLKFLFVEQPKLFAVVPCRYGNVAII